ncbi:hypothetical protein [Nitratireductor sp. GCM10026969]|uniref:hypothetical protein n=1 Tax=Nitratireductor sp. GCM10026969 TaxID=3252645 RepID=UPI003618867C
MFFFREAVGQGAETPRRVEWRASALPGDDVQDPGSAGLYNPFDQAEFVIQAIVLRFLGLSLPQKVPDAKTISSFRESLVRAGAVDNLLTCFDKLHLVRPPRCCPSAHLYRKLESGLGCSFPSLAPH